MSRFKRFLRQSRGANAVEFALIAPLFLLLVFGMIDFGLIFSDWLVLTNGVREGARAGVVVEGNVDTKKNEDNNPPNVGVYPTIDSYVAVFGGLTGLTSPPSVECRKISDGTLEPNCDSGTTSLKVTATRTRLLITPLGNFMAWFGGGMGNQFPLSATSVMRNE